jgi:SNF2 family DNA or RNA helicase
VKEDVAKDIPAKEETVIDVELTSIQKQYYRAIFEHNHAFLSMGSSKAVAPKLMNIQMELRKCCNHPFLLDGVESREMEKRHEILRHNGELDSKTPDEQHEILNHYGYVLSSGKMVLLDKLLPKLRAEGHKVRLNARGLDRVDTATPVTTSRILTLGICPRHHLQVLIFSQFVKMLDLISGEKKLQVVKEPILLSPESFLKLLVSI